MTDMNVQLDDNMYNSVRIESKVDNFIGLLDNALDIIQAPDLYASTPARTRSGKLADTLSEIDEEPDIKTR